MNRDLEHAAQATDNYCDCKDNLAGFLGVNQSNEWFCAKCTLKLRVAPRTYTQGELREALATEREACAGAAEKMVGADPFDDSWVDACWHVAEAIRARGK